MGMNKVKVLSVGINAYKSAPLAGCVNDSLNIAETLPAMYGINEDSIRLLVDERATKYEIMKRLRWLVEGAKAGDCLCFHFSGHGSQVADRSGLGEVDGLSEILCPVDMKWHPDYYITDTELYHIFKHIPMGCRFAWINDSCHSGGLTSQDRSIHNPPKQTPRFLPPPEDIQWKIRIANQKKLITTREDKKLNVQFVSGCKSDQTSADTYINGKPCGAMTYHFIRNLKKMKKDPFKDIVERTQKDLKYGMYTQIPQAEGNQIDYPFWADEITTMDPPPEKRPQCIRRWYFPWTWGCKG